MPRYVAFLRAINVGGHTVAMSTLRDLFAQMGLRNAETFIASGNVVFESGQAAAALEKRIEKRLESALGYSVATFVRTDEQVRAISLYRPFSDAAMKTAQALNIGFLRGPLAPGGLEALRRFRTEIDDFRAHGSEIYWLCRKKQSESTFNNRVFERAADVRATFRGASTIVRLAGKLAA
ncbi:MAG: DUF1697 domain-containing protein [Bryobacteraceae bacterium]